MENKKRYRLLLVEDNPVQAALIQGLLREENYLIQWVTTAEDGLSYLQQHSVDLILMDVGLPGINGYDAVRQIRLMDGDAWRPILMVTADDSVRGWQETLECGADDYLHKPIKKHKIISKISIMLRLYTSYYDNQQAQKLKALGQFAAGIAHDFNNLLLIIKGNAEMIHDDPNDAHDSQLSAQDILSAVSRSQELIEQLEIYASDRQPSLEPLFLVPFLDEYVRWYAKHLPQNLQLQGVIDPALNQPAILANSVQITRVLDNLLKNAVLAMQKKEQGCIRLCLQPVLDSTQKALVQQVKLQVIDEGEGIAEEHLSVLFDPFFTTRDVWQGFGLGLSVVAGIVRQHHGQIKVHSQVGVGTTFELIFPTMIQSHSAGAV